MFASKHFIWTGSVYRLSIGCRQAFVLREYRGSHIASPFSLLTSSPRSDTDDIENLDR